MRISVVSCRSPAPRMRALAMRFRSTSRTPWNALKKTTKKTSTAAVAIFDLMSRPSATANRAPTTTRGMALAPLMYGPSTSGSSRLADPVGACMRTLSRAAALLTFIAHQDLVLEVLPHLFVDLGETWLEANFGDVARPRKVDLVVALDRAGSGGDHEDAVA